MTLNSFVCGVFRVTKGALAIVLTLSIYSLARADDYLPMKPSEKYYTKDGSILQFMTKRECAVNSCVIIFREKLLLEAGKSDQGVQRNFAVHNAKGVYQIENGRKVRLNGHIVLLRLVVQEFGRIGDENKYWIIDLSDQDPAVIGPLSDQDYSKEFSLIRGEKSLDVVLDNGSNDWKDADRTFVEGESIRRKDGRMLPIMTIGKNQSKKMNGFIAFHYDYEKKNVTTVFMIKDE